MPRPRPEIDVDDLVSLYEEGATIRQLREHFSCRASFVTDELKRLGLQTDRRRKPVDTARALELWESGMDKKAIGETLGVSQTTITNRLRDVGVMTESPGDAMRTRMSRMSAEDRAALCRPAHDAVRGMRRTHDDLVRRAIGKAKLGRPGSTEEERLGKMLRERGLTVAHQAAVDKYNVDLLVDGSIAVEVSGRPKKGANAERIPERVKLLLDRGLALLLVWSNTKWHPVTEDAAEYVVSLLDLLRRDPSATGKYWVIWGDGQVMAERRPYSDDLPCVLSPIRRGRQWA